MKLHSIIAFGSAFCALAASSLLTGCASTPAAGTNPGATAGTPKQLKNVDLLFVQSSTGLSARKGRITLHGVNPLTVAFSDRPDRVAGHITTKEFVPMWSQGKDSFLKDPPNATLSVFNGRNVSNAVVTLRNPRLSGSDLSYDVTLLEGSLPNTSGACSLFIDIIGMPLTPMSYAGAARRAWRRGAYAAPIYHPPYASPTIVHYGPYGTTVVRRW